MTTSVEEEVQTGRPDYKYEEGDKDKFAHYVIGGNDAIIRSMISGDPVTALCGKVWVPSRDPERFPVCPECKEIKEMHGFSEGGDVQP